MNRKLQILLPFCILATLAAVFAGAEEAPPPQGYSWQRLDLANGRILKPKNWFCYQITVAEGFGYMLTEEDKGKVSDYRTGVKIKYTTLDPKTTKRTAFEIASMIYQKRKATGSVSDLSLGTNGPYRSLSFFYDGAVQYPDGPQTHHYVHYILAHDGTRTLIYFTFECPLELWPQKVDTFNTMCRNITFFEPSETDNQPNQPPLRMPVSGTPAADAPVAPPPGIAGR